MCEFVLFYSFQGDMQISEVICVCLVRGSVSFVTPPSGNPCTMGEYYSIVIRPNKNICVFRVTLPCLILLVKPAIFSMFSKRKRCY